MTLSLEDWHLRFQQQARWTESVRAHLFLRAGLHAARRILEVGCGTGAVTASAAQKNPAMEIFGADIDLPRLRFARGHDPAGVYVCGDALRLPFRDGAFDLAFCHYLLLWVGGPERAVREMARVTRRGGWVAAMAEPDYDARIDTPAPLAEIGRRQTESLRRQGADPAVGRRLAEIFSAAGIRLLENGVLESRPAADAPSDAEADLERKVLREDIGDGVSETELNAYLAADRAARANRERVLFIPTYYAAGTRN
jgi:ubiquinone/menaquinone biosynthesis C-methylase UbiE